MKNQKKIYFNLIALFYAIAIFIFSIPSISSWTFMIIIWFSVFFYFHFTHKISNLPKPFTTIYYATIFIYPLLETIIKYMIEYNIIAYSWFWLNRFEHFLWAFAVIILLIPLFINIIKKLLWWQSAFLIVGLIFIIGNGIEFIQFIIRYYYKPRNSVRFIAYYRDTIYDMMSNSLGSIMGFFILYQIKNK